MRTREQRIADTFVELADTLVAEFDLIEFLHRLVECTVDLVDADAGGLMLADQRGGLEVMAASSHATRLLELFELQHDEGPCLDAFRSGRTVSRSDLAAMTATWPRFTPRMVRAGFASAEAVPMRLRDQVIGALNVFRVGEGALSTADLDLAQALADVATVGILQQRVITANELLAEQLQGALTSRVRIEQAKGVLAERSGIDVDQAFEVMRSSARRTGRQLSSVVDAVLDGTFPLPG
jgi:transcriptional regulator with GAF, ATPase, and Fis domain